MSYFFYILIHQILPIFLLIGIGYIINSKYGLDVRTLSRLTVYALVPGFIFVNIYETGVPPELMKALIFGFILLIPSWLLAEAYARINGYPQSLRNAIINSVLFYNSGNFGVPLITLVFASSPLSALAVSTQIMVLLAQNLTTNTLGFFLAGQAQLDKRHLMKMIFGIPSIYALGAALLFKSLPIDAKTLFFWPTLVYLKGGLIPAALFTLGVQLSKSKVILHNPPVWGATILRLAGGPLTAFALIHFMSIHGIMAQVLFIGSGLPSAVSTALAAVEFDNEADFAAQTVLVTTLLCALTLALLIPIAGILYPA